MQAETIGPQQHVAHPSSARSQAIVGAVMAAFLGALLVWGVGLSPIAALHNAAHDTRHSMAFPCH